MASPRVITDFSTFVASVTHDEGVETAAFSAFDAADAHASNTILELASDHLDPRGQVTGHVIDRPEQTTTLRTYFYDVSVQALDTDEMRELTRATSAHTDQDAPNLELTAEQIHRILNQPVADQPWMICAYRFQGGAARWDWKPELMRLIHVEQMGGCESAGVYLVASCGNGGRAISTDGILTVFAIDSDEFGDPDVFMYGESRDLNEVLDLFNNAADEYAVDLITLDTLIGKLEKFL
jgi:hypothetical protein